MNVIAKYIIIFIHNAIFNISELSADLKFTRYRLYLIFYFAKD